MLLNFIIFTNEIEQTLIKIHVNEILPIRMKRFMDLVRSVRLMTLELDCICV